MELNSDNEIEMNYLNRNQKEELIKSNPVQIN